MRFIHIKKRVRMILKLILIAVMLTANISCFGAQVWAGSTRLQDYVPRPELLAPVSDNVDLRGQKELVFRWSSHKRPRKGVKSYDFRLYNGFEMLESTLIHKELIPGLTYGIVLNADQFTGGNVYTWSLKQIAQDGKKSERSFSSFKVLK